MSHWQWDQSFLRLSHFLNVFKCVFLVFSGEEEAKLRLHSEYEMCATQMCGQHVGKVGGIVGLLSRLSGVGVSGEMNSENYLRKLKFLGN